MAAHNGTKASQGAMSEHASKLTDDVRKAGSAVRQMATDRAEQVRDTANDYLEQGQERMREASEGLQERVRNEPTKSLLIAAGIGFLLGIVWVRR